MRVRELLRFFSVLFVGLFWVLNFSDAMNSGMRSRGASDVNSSDWDPGEDINDLMTAFGGRSSYGGGSNPLYDAALLMSPDDVAYVYRDADITVLVDPFKVGKTRGLEIPRRGLVSFPQMVYLLIIPNIPCDSYSSLRASGVAGKRAYDKIIAVADFFSKALVNPASFFNGKTRDLFVLGEGGEAVGLEYGDGDDLIEISGRPFVTVYTNDGAARTINHPHHHVVANVIPLRFSEFVVECRKKLLALFISEKYIESYEAPKMLSSMGVLRPGRPSRVSGFYRTCLIRNLAAIGKSGESPQAILAAKWYRDLIVEFHRWRSGEVGFKGDVELEGSAIELMQQRVREVAAKITVLKRELSQVDDDVQSDNLVNQISELSAEKRGLEKALNEANGGVRLEDADYNLRRIFTDRLRRARLQRRRCSRGDGGCSSAGGDESPPPSGGEELQHVSDEDGDDNSNDGSRSSGGVDFDPDLSAALEGSTDSDDLLGGAIKAAQLRRNVEGGTPDSDGSDATGKSESPTRRPSLDKRGGYHGVDSATQMTPKANG